MTAPKVEFPNTYGWVSSTMHNFQPSALSIEGHRKLVALLVRRDHQLMGQVKAHCAKRWAIAARLGTGTLHVRLFDLSPTHLTHQSEYTGCEGMEVLIVNKRLQLHNASPEERELALSQRPFAYADRLLTPAEIEEIHHVIGTLYHKVGTDNILPVPAHA